MRLKLVSLSTGVVSHNPSLNLTRPSKRREPLRAGGLER